MTKLHALRHVSNAVHQAEALAGEADDLGATQLALRLRASAAEVATELEAAVQAVDDVGPASEARKRTHEMLSVAYSEVTLRIEQATSPEDSSRLSPGGHLDVVERVRYRLRQLRDESSEELRDVRALLERALFAYDSSIDDYLMACAAAQTKKDCALVKSQALRIELERAKHGLLMHAPTGSDSYKRIKRLTVRTKRARWLDDAKAARLLENAIA
jgi:hypothetical protein